MLLSCRQQNKIDHEEEDDEFFETIDKREFLLDPVKSKLLVNLRTNHVPTTLVRIRA